MIMKILRWLFPVMGDMKDASVAASPPSPREKVKPPPAKPFTKQGYRYVGSMPVNAATVEALMALQTGIVSYDTPFISNERNHGTND